MSDSACLHTFIVVLLYFGMKNNGELFKKINKELFLKNFIEAQKMELNSKPSAVFDSWRKVENKHISDLSKLGKYLPEFHFSEVHPNVVSDNKNTSKVPFIKCLASFQIGSEKRRLSIFIGPLSDFKQGKNDLNCVEIAKHKFFEFLLKNYGYMFSRNTSDGKISLESFLEQIKEKEKINKSLEKWRELNLKNDYEHALIKSEVESFKLSNFIPEFQFSEIRPKVEGRSENSRSITFPHIKCVAIYHMGNSKKRLSIFIGPLEKFPDGKNDELCIHIAKEKLFEHYVKKYPDVFEY